MSILPQFELHCAGRRERSALEEGKKHNCNNNNDNDNTTANNESNSNRNSDVPLEDGGLFREYSLSASDKGIYCRIREDFSPDVFDL